jgi:hypothetical protein
VKLSPEMQAQVTKQVQESLDAGKGIPDHVNVTDGHGCIWRLSNPQVRAIDVEYEPSEAIQVEEVPIAIEPLKIAKVDDGYFFRSIT